MVRYFSTVFSCSNEELELLADNVETGGQGVSYNIFWNTNDKATMFHVVSESRKA